MGLALGADHQLAGFVIRRQCLDVGVFRRRKIGAAVEDRDRVALRRIFGEAARVLDARIAGADDDDMLVDILGRIIELILYVRQIGAGAAHPVGVALRADGEDHVLGHHRLAIGQLDGIGRGVALDFAGRGAAIARAGNEGLHAAGDRIAGAADRFCLGHVFDVDLVAFDLLVPGAEDHLALARLEIDVGAQHQIGGRRHDVLALLVFVDRVREVIGFFEQHMAQTQRRRTRGCAQARGPGSNDRHLEHLGQLSSPLRG